MTGSLALVNGTVHTGDPSLPRASAVVIEQGSIAYVGDDDAALQIAHDGRNPLEVIDLRRRTVLPGLADAHLHLTAFGLSLRQVDVETSTLEEALARVAERASQTPPGGWILGRGWNHNVWPAGLPTAEHLDRVAPHHPVRLTTKSGHASWVNTRALAMAGITAGTPDPEGGAIVRSADGAPTGILLEGAAMELVDRLIASPSLDDRVEALRHACGEAVRHGLTAVHDMDGVDSFRAAQILHARGELPIRIVKSIPLEALDAALELGLRGGYGDPRLRIGALKIFADGALGPRTAWMLDPYETAPGGTGIPTIAPEVLRSAVLRTNAAGLACAVHAIGDRACRLVLDTYAEARNRYPKVRNRIEHLQILHPRDIARVAQLGVVASMQPIHCTSDLEISDRHLGSRAAGAYAFRDLLEAGATLAFGSDTPVEPIAPLAGLHAAVTRRRPDGSPGPEGWFPRQRLSVAEAVRAYTWGPAYAAGLERWLGALTRGRMGDLTILEEDPHAVDPMRIPEIGVAATLVEGEFAWRSASL